MIAYKVFMKKYNLLYPIFVYDKFRFYPLGFIHIRTDNCGPFACFKKSHQAFRFMKGWQNSVVHQVEIKQSQDKTIWADTIDDGMRKPVLEWYPGTILADEFEILEEIK